ncbi:hypothetical protein [Nocardiopsis potens]|uniref:hypothetical protein n=1 Tax=Nocardiopsis potens TaxID=1246458 RepID=UPI0003454137|nr:hypothetical protein [Nocardiopsis potens]
MAPYSPVRELNLLKELEESLGNFRIADGFEMMREYGDDSGLRAGGPSDPEFLSRLIPFAQANGSGSFYALWRCDDREDLASLPVVIFGDEGGQGVAACDLRGLLLLAEDSELGVDHGDAPYFRGPTLEEWKEELDEDEYVDTEEALAAIRKAREDYRAWLRENFDLTPPENIQDVLDEAHRRHGERFAAWMSPYLP